MITTPTVINYTSRAYIVLFTLSRSLYFSTSLSHGLIISAYGVRLKPFELTSL